jgi:alkylation response protein AidB-like acyl-CoA dehydrogenase
VTKRLPGFVYECMEAMGGNGYVEDFPMARYGALLYSLCCVNTRTTCAAFERC